MATTPNNPEVILPERAPRLWVPLRFMLAGLGFLAALLLFALFQAPDLAADYRMNPAVLTATHLFTLGFAGMITSGALYQMVPVLLHQNLWSERLADLHLAIQGVGAATLSYGFFNQQTGPIITGGTLVVVGALLLLLNLFRTARAAPRRNLHAGFMGAALLFYLITISWGLLLATNQRYGFLIGFEQVSLPTHLLLGLGGWFSLLIFGVALKLVPMFAPSRPLPTRVRMAVGGSAAVGITVTLIGLWTSAGLLSLGIVIMALATLAYTGALWYSFAVRRSGPLDFSVRFALLASLFLVGTVAAGVGGWVSQGLNRSQQAGLVWLFALAWIGGTIIGMLLRILPFMVWLHRFRHRLDRQERIPFLHELFHPALGWCAFHGWFVGAGLLALGVGTFSPGHIQLGAGIGALGAVAFGAAVFQTLRQIPPGTPPRYPGRKS